MMVGLILLFILTNGYQIKSDDALPTLTIKGYNSSGGYIRLICKRNESINSDVFYKFWKEDVNITTYQRGNSFNMLNVQTIASGNYSCSTKVNKTVSTSTKKELKVSLTVWLSFGMVVEGGSLNFTCLVGGEETVQTFVWKEDGVTIPLTSSVLILRNISRKDSNKVYNCMAVKADGEKSNEASQSLNVLYIDKPVLKLKHYVEEGSLVHMTCEASSNPSITRSKWFKNGEPIVQPNLYNELYFRSVQSSDAGNYSCSQENQYIPSIEKSSEAETLTVLYMSNPYIKFLNNTSAVVVEGRQVVFSCQVDRYNQGLTLDYEWRLEIGDSILGRSKQFVIHQMKPKDADSYTCAVTGNLMGLNFTKVASVSLKIHFAPKDVNFLYDIKVLKVKLHSSLTKKCFSYHYGSPPATLYWFKDNEMTPVLNGTLKTPLLLTIDSIKRNQAGNYSCCSINYVGSICKTFTIIVTEKPGPPGNITVVETGEHFITVRWRSPKFDGNRPIKSYELQIKEKNKNWNTSFDYRSLNKDRLSLKMIGLKPGVVYTVRVRSTNDDGTGLFSHLFEVATKPAHVPNPPNDFKQILPALSCAIKVSWEPLNETIYDWILVFKLSDGTQSSDLAQLSSSATNYTIVKLDKYAAYNLTLYARNNNRDGVKVNLFYVYTREEKPEEVRKVRITEGQTNMVVSWQPPNNIYGQLRGYTVCHRKFSSTDDLICSNVTSTTYNITSLQHEQAYSIRVTAFNTLFSSNGFMFQKKTIGLAPPPIPSLPEPSESKITGSSFTITIVLFDESNGRIHHYDIIVMPLPDGNLPSRKPNEYSNSEIESYVVGRFFSPKNNQQFVVGNGDAFQRKRRTLGFPENSPLTQGSVYTAFVRGYITEDVYQSTPWYKPIKTKRISQNADDSGLSGGAIAGIIIAVLVVVCVVIAVFFLYKRSTEVVNRNIGLETYQQKYGTSNE